MLEELSLEILHSELSEVVVGCPGDYCPV